MSIFYCTSVVVVVVKCGGISYWELGTEYRVLRMFFVESLSIDGLWKITCRGSGPLIVGRPYCLWDRRTLRRRPGEVW